MSRFKLLWNDLRESFWFVPSLVVTASMAAAVGLIEADLSGSDQWRVRWPRLFGAGAAGARGVLSTIAGAMMSVVGVTFSMTLVALALASSQYSARVLRNFMRSRLTQSVLGVFAGIFTYCLIVLRTIRGGDEGAFVPALAVLFAVLLAIGGVGVLIMFIHHIATSIQASSIIASVAQETLATIDRLFPEDLGQDPGEDGEEPLPPLPKRSWHVVVAGESGYIQSVDGAALLRVARETGSVLRMERGIGEFAVQDSALVSLALDKPPDPATSAALQAAFSIRRHRTVEQDPAFGIRQIVDVALRALSPGVNDTTTAVTCIDYLTTIMARLAVRRIPSLRRYEDGELRALAIGPTFVSLLAESFDDIRSSAQGNAVILSRMLDAVCTLAALTATARRRQTLREHVDWIAEVAGRTLPAAHDRAVVDSRLARARVALAAS